VARRGRNQPIANLSGGPCRMLFIQMDGE